MLPAEFDIGELHIRQVEGEAVRNEFGSGFTMGGHHERWPYIPEGEVWIEEGMSSLDQLATLVHELYEIELMDSGLSYDEAHDRADVVEDRFRRKCDAEGVSR